MGRSIGIDTVGKKERGDAGAQKTRGMLVGQGESKKKKKKKKTERKKLNTTKGRERTPRL